MKRLSTIIKDPRVIIALIVLILAIVVIQPNPFIKGVAIRAVTTNSSAAVAGIENPKAAGAPMSREVIHKINNIPINNIKDYYDLLSSFTYNMSVEINTNKKSYHLVTKPTYDVTGKITGVEDIGLSVYNAPTNNIREGLDLVGGTRVVLKPEEKLSAGDFEMLIANLKQRLNLFGLNDIVVRSASDLSGNNFVLVEVAGAKKDEVRDLLAKQGKFEAKVGNVTVFLGGHRDVTYVCRSGECAGLDPQYGCGEASTGNWVCRFRFSIALSPEAATRQANSTAKLDVVPSGEESFLSKNLDLFLDDNKVDSLKIGADLRGKVATDIAISGSGSGTSEQEAANNAFDQMKKLQTVLITGSLPTKLIVSQMSSISPTLGEEFVKNAFILAAIVLITVAAMILIRYRRLKIAIPIIITICFELIMLLGMTSLIGQNMDLAAIAGLIVVIGDSSNDQIVITDEILRGGGKTQVVYNWAERIKNAFSIIFGAYFTLMVAMIPLIWAGAGLLRGFAITTIIGATIGVVVTRPAFANVAEFLIKE